MAFSIISRMFASSCLADGLPLARGLRCLWSQSFGGSTAPPLKIWRALLESNAPTEVKEYVWDQTVQLAEKSMELQLTKDNVKVLMDTKDRELERRTGELFLARRLLNMRGIIEYFQQEMMPLKQKRWNKKDAFKCWVDYLQANEDLLDHMEKRGLGRRPSDIASAITKAYSALSEAIHDYPAFGEYSTAGYKLRIGKPLDGQQCKALIGLCQAIGLGWECTEEDV